MEKIVSRNRRKFFSKVKRLSARGIKGEKHEKLSIFHAFLPQTPLGADKKSFL